MIVYEAHLYWALAACVFLGFVLGLTFAWWYDERQRIVRLRKDFDESWKQYHG